jgi:hypothetical protein
MGKRLFAVKFNNDTEDEIVELSDEIYDTFYLTRFDPIDRKDDEGVELFELTSFKPSNACKYIINEITEFPGIEPEWISPDTVKNIYQLVEKIEVEKTVAEYDGEGSPPEPLEIVELIKFLKACSDCNLGLWNPPYDFG